MIRSISTVLCCSFILCITTTANAQVPNADRFNGGTNTHNDNKLDLGFYRQKEDLFNLYKMGIEHLQAKEYEAAEKNFKRFLKSQKGHAKANYYMGLTKLGNNDQKTAARFIEKSLKRDDSLVEAYGVLGTIYASLEKTEKAQRILRQLELQAATCGDCEQSNQIQTAQNMIELALNNVSKHHDL